MTTMRRFLMVVPLVFALLAQAACSDPTVHSTLPRVWMVAIVVTPNQARYAVGDRVHVDYVVLDRYGQQVEGIGATWQNPPAADVLNLGGGDFEFTTVGAFTWKVTLEAPHGLTASTTLEVPAVPTSVEIEVDPLRDHYALQDAVALDYVVRDQLGDVMNGVPASWQNPPPAQVQDDGGQHFTFIQEGTFTWTVVLDDHPGVTDSVSLTVDGSGPVVIIEVPERGDTIQQEGADDRVTVVGHVEDPVAGVDTLTIETNAMAETRVQVDADGSFSLSTPAVAGLNVVVAEAVDSLGNHTTVTRAYHYASDFFAFENDHQGRVLLDDLLQVWISERGLDRGTPPGYDPCAFDAQDAYRCDEILDLASLLELALNNIDFAGAIPGQDFNFPIVDEAWQLTLADFGEVNARLEGDFDLEFSFESVKAGLAKVEAMQANAGGVHADISYRSYTDAAGEEHPGLAVELGMTGTLTFQVWLDLVTNDPNAQFLLCALADNLCNPDPPYDCLGEYLESCTANPVPVVQSVSSIDTPMLAGLGVETMDIDLALLAELAGDPLWPDFALADLVVSFGQGELDLSALEDVTVNIGTITVGSYQIDLGTYQFPTTFLSDLVDDLLDPLLNALRPFLEAVVGEVFDCEDPLNPVCYVIPFLEEMLGAFATEKDIQVDDPFDPAPDAPPLAETHLVFTHNELAFASGDGGRLKLSARIDSQKDEAIDAHADDDMLGVALTDGCLQGDPGFGGYPVGESAIQLAMALDLANMGLYAVWYNGGMELALDETAFVLDPALDVSALGIDLAMWLPPRLTGCGMDGDLVQAELGDLHLSGSVTRAGRVISFSGFISISVPGALAADASGENVRVDLYDFASFFAFEPESVLVDGAKPAPEQREALRALLRDVLAPQLLERLTSLGMRPLENISPTYDISAFLGLAPGSQLMRIGDFVIHQDEEFAILNGELVQLP